MSMVSPMNAEWIPAKIANVVAHTGVSEKVKP